MAEVIWLRRSLFDLRDISDHIAQSDPTAAVQISNRLQEAGNSLGLFPNRGRPAGKATRVLATVPPFLVYYEVEGEIVFILTIRHGRRRPLTL